MALQLQKANQTSGNNKGHTFLIFDDNKVKADTLSDLLWKPPAWTDDYYGRKKRQDPLDQIIDTTFSIKSHHAGLVQVADLFAFIFRRYAGDRRLRRKGRMARREGVDRRISGFACGAASLQVRAMAGAHPKQRREMVQRDCSSFPESARIKHVVAHRKILIIAKPNGVGKTTLATEYLLNQTVCPSFVNADSIDAGLSSFRRSSVAFRAGRLMIETIHGYAARTSGPGLATSEASTGCMWSLIAPVRGCDSFASATPFGISRCKPEVAW